MSTLTDTPASVAPPDEFAPDAGSLRPGEYADALQDLDVTCYFPAGDDGTFRFFRADNPIDPNQAFAVFAFLMPEDGTFAFRLDVGPVPHSGFERERVLCWIVDDERNVVYRGSAQSLGRLRDTAELAQGAHALVLRLVGTDRLSASITSVNDSGGLAEIASGDSLTSEGNGRHLAYGDRVLVKATNLYDGYQTVLGATSPNSFVIDAAFQGNATGTMELPADFAGLAPVECSLSSAAFVTGWVPVSALPTGYGVHTAPGSYDAARKPAVDFGVLRIDQNGVFADPTFFA